MAAIGAWGYREPQRTKRELYLEDELNRMREREEREHQRESEERERRRYEREEQYQDELRSAETWPEALRKQAYLMGVEAGTDDDTDTYFGDGQAACNRALEIWKEVEASKQTKIEELKRQIEAIEDGIRLEVADKLRAECNRPGWIGIAASIKEGGDVNNFLYW